MAPVLTAKVLTVTFVYCFAKIHQKELKGEEEGQMERKGETVGVLLNCQA